MTSVGRAGSVVVVVVVVVVSPGSVDEVVVVVVVDVVDVVVVVVSPGNVDDVVEGTSTVGQLLVRTRAVWCAGELLPPGSNVVVVVNSGEVETGSVSVGVSESVGISASVSAGAVAGGSLCSHRSN